MCLHSWLELSTWKTLSVLKNHYDRQRVKFKSHFPHFQCSSEENNIKYLRYPFCTFITFNLKIPSIHSKKI